MSREYPTQPIVGVGAVVLRHNAESASFEVLLVKRANAPSQGEWSLPGGVVETGERLEEAVVREVLEESGLDVEAVARVEVLDHIVRDLDSDRIRFHYVLIDFVCRVTGGALECATDALDVEWCPVDDLDAYALRVETLDVIQKAVAGVSGPNFSA